MDKPLLIWSPVISAQLSKLRRIKGSSNYELDKKYNSIEDVKIKVRQSEAIIQGYSVQVNLILEILCLLEDKQEGMQLVTWHEQCKERVSLTDFDSTIDNRKQVYMRLDFTDCAGFGELNGQEINIDYYVDYSLIATQEQIIEISPASQGEAAVVSLRTALEKLEYEVEQVENENGQLRRQLFFYERDISSLKRGLWKAENRNAILNREKKEHQALIGKLQGALKQDVNAYQTEQNYFTGDVKLNRPTAEANLNLGSRLKRMFMNSL